MWAAIGTIGSFAIRYFKELWHTRFCKQSASSEAATDPNMCSFWLVEALTRAGQIIPEKLDQARLLFERMLGCANHLGLYAE